MVIEDGKNYFKTEEFSSFIGDKIYKAGCPIFSISAGREFTKFKKWFNRLFFKEYSNYVSKYEFLDTNLLRAAMIKLPFYVKILLKVTRFFDKFTKKLRKTA
jgi:hypothetical protein